MWLDVLDKYAGLLIIQYRYLPKASATMRLIANQNVCDGLPFTEQNCFDLDTASGEQLTVLGKIIGVPRDVSGLDLAHTFFAFVRYNDTSAGIGFGRYKTSPYPSDLWYRYNNYAIYTTSDFELRSLIRLKIISNNTYMSLKNLVELITDVFGTDITVGESAKSLDASLYTFFNFTRYSPIIMNTGFGRYSDSPYPTGLWYRYVYFALMTLTYRVKTKYQTVMTVADYLNIIPKPMSVKVNVVFN
jgi:hypothetical protein